MKSPRPGQRFRPECRILDSTPFLVWSTYGYTLTPTFPLPVLPSLCPPPNLPSPQAGPIPGFGIDLALPSQRPSVQGLPQAAQTHFTTHLQHSQDGVMDLRWPSAMLGLRCVLPSRLQSYPHLSGSKPH